MPARLRDVTRALSEWGVEVEKPKGGSHWKARRKGYRVFPLPAHNAGKSEIDDKYIAALCRNLGIPEEEFRKKL